MTKINKICKVQKWDSIKKGLAETLYFHFKGWIYFVVYEHCKFVIIKSIILRVYSNRGKKTLYANLIEVNSQILLHAILTKSFKAYA